ncbi:hypothetical protein YTPLAS72_14030 [Nitrospira sp.]|nr:hypothetical protein YTPLAS72_14030 [Nitrospira sp.]
MDRIRVLLGNHPLMVPHALRQMLTEQEDMEVVGDCRGPMKILQETGKVNADIVVLAQEGSEEIGLCSQLLAVYPDLTIVIVDPTLDIAFTQQLCSYRKKVVTSDQLDIVRTMRIAARQPCNRA